MVKTGVYRLEYTSIYTVVVSNPNNSVTKYGMVVDVDDIGDDAELE